jgi:triacylglycerol lipase
VTPDSSRPLVDPELAPFLELLPFVELTDEALPAMRERSFPLPFDPALAETVSRTVRANPGPPGAPDVSVSCYRPKDTEGALPCILHIHGGGFILGSATEMQGPHLALTAALGCAIVSVDYRLAPEAPFLGSVEDCYAALAWLNAHPDLAAVDASRIGVMGESAGGGLAAALALLARDRSEHRLAFQHLIYPMLDDRTSCVGAADLHPFAGEFVWPHANNRFGWRALLGAEPGGDDVSPYAAPARATDLAGLPPTYIATGALDLFVDEDLDYGRRLMRAGVPVEMHVYPGAFHAFDFVPDADVSIRARRDSLASLERCLKGPGGAGASGDSAV